MDATQTRSRLTPGQVIWELELTPGSVERALSLAGYVIVHPDDVPEKPTHLGEPDGYSRPQLGEFRGWNACRAHIFGDA